MIALFGGAFDPPHLGHVLAATYARVRHGVEAVWVLPTCRHPWGKATTPFAQRLAWCRAAFADLPFVAVRDDEQDNASGTTWDLLDRLEAAHPRARFALLGGSDTGRDMASWHRGGELSRRLPVLVVPRRGQGGDADPAALPAISSSLVRQRLAEGKPIDDLLPAAVARLIVPLTP